jgi:hypothetical protein
MKKLYLFVLMSACYALQAQVTLTSGGNITSNAGAYMVFNNIDLINNGTIVQSVGNGTAKFTGNTTTQLGGSSPATFDKVELVKGSGDLTLQQNANVITSFTFTSGLLNLNASHIILSTGGLLLNESETSRSYTLGDGYIENTGVLTSPSSANLGNLGAVITSAQNLGSTLIRRGHKVQVGPLGNSILRFFDITPTNDAGLNATLRVRYFDAELNGLTEGNLSIWKSTDLGSTWTDMNYSTRDGAANYVEQTGLADLSRWSLFAMTPLPVTFVSFNGNCTNGRMSINWKTANEFNIQRYEVEESLNGIQWHVAGSVNAANNSSSNTYNFSVTGAAQYFRIAQIGVGGPKTYSAVLRISCGAAESINIFPNPVYNAVNINVVLGSSSTLNFRLYDSKGSLLMVKLAAVSAGANIVTYDMSRLPKGAYTAAIEIGGKLTSIILEKQ